MRYEYSILPPLYPVSQPSISRFYAHAMDVYESPGDAPTDGYDDLKPPAYTASGRHLFSRRLSPPLLARQDGHSPQQLRKLASPPHNPRFRGIGASDAEPRRLPRPSSQLDGHPRQRRYRHPCRHHTTLYPSNHPPRAAACRPVRRGFAASPAHFGQICGRQTEPLCQRKGRGIDGGFLPLQDHRAGQQKHRRPPSQAHRIPGSPGEETRAGREGPQKQYLCLSG